MVEEGNRSREGEKERNSVLELGIPRVKLYNLTFSHQRDDF